MPGLSTKVHFGVGSIRHLPDIVAPLATRVLVVSSPGLPQILGLEALVIRRLRNRGISVHVFEGVEPNPTERVIEAGVGHYNRYHAELILGVGGGSSLDAAKLIGLLATSPGPLNRYCGTNRLSPPLPPIIAVPTTAGSGSEVTPYAVCTTDTPEGQMKMVVRNRRLSPLQAVIDPLLTLSCPSHLVSATGIDALCHALESYLSPRAFIQSEQMALKALDLIGCSLPGVIRDKFNPHGREHLAHGAFLSGACIALTGATLLHAMTYPVTSELSLPHGWTIGLLLPSFWKHSYQYAKSRFQSIFAALTGSHTTDVNEQVQVLKVFLASAGFHPPRHPAVAATQLERWAGRVGKNREKVQATPGFSGSEDILSVYQQSFFPGSKRPSPQ